MKVRIPVHALLACAALLLACGSDPVPVASAPVADTAGAPADAAVDPGDATSDATGAELPSDTASAPDAAADAAPDPGPSPDTKTKDVPPTKEELCEGYAKEYATLFPKVQVCGKDSDCGMQMPDSVKCGCGHFVNFGAPDRGTMQARLQDFVSHGCSTGFCGDPKCEDLTTAVGVCTAGKCASVKATCDGLEAAWKQVLAEVSVCVGDGDCAGSVAGSLACECPVAAQAKLVGAGSPHALYMALLQKLFGDLQCPLADCDCGDAKPGKCITGKCQAN